MAIGAQGLRSRNAPFAPAFTLLFIGLARRGLGRQREGAVMERCKKMGARAARLKAGGLRRQGGVALIEYALLTGLIAVALVARLGQLGAALEGVFKAISAALQGV